MGNKELSTILKDVSILYVEDDKIIRDDMHKALSMYSNHVMVASSGFDALDIYYENSPQIIISDILMPKLNGINFIKKIREDNINIPVILLTAFTDKEYLLPAANLNIQSYLVKPVKSSELKESLYKAVKILNENSPLFVSLPNSLKYDKLNSQLLCQNGEKVKLNRKEKKLVDLLISNSNRVVTYNEIENHVWSEYYEVMTSMALRTIIKNLRKKVCSSFIENISGQGYKVSISNNN